ncbi:hypothetical protein OF83DRAFT_504152 [Amylostereum chailletii]|nr:hypothetical protein OF83DRAFT_504152 [Amylostereum chailletii]
MSSSVVRDGGGLEEGRPEAMRLSRGLRSVLEAALTISRATDARSRDRSLENNPIWLQATTNVCRCEDREARAHEGDGCIILRTEDSEEREPPRGRALAGVAAAAERTAMDRLVHIRHLAFAWPPPSPPAPPNPCSPFLSPLHRTPATSGAPLSTLSSRFLPLGFLPISHALASARSTMSIAFAHALGAQLGKGGPCADGITEETHISSR